MSATAITPPLSGWARFKRNLVTLAEAVDMSEAKLHAYWQGAQTEAINARVIDEQNQAFARMMQQGA